MSRSPRGCAARAIRPAPKLSPPRSRSLAEKPPIYCLDFPPTLS